jgi:hypothetical protein
MSFGFEHGSIKLPMPNREFQSLQAARHDAAHDKTRETLG